MTKRHSGGDAQTEALPQIASHAADRLVANKERILSRWEERLRKNVAAAGRESSSILIDTLPAVLDHLAQALSPLHPRSIATAGARWGMSTAANACG